VTTQRRRDERQKSDAYWVDFDKIDVYRSTTVGSTDFDDDLEVGKPLTESMANAVARVVRWLWTFRIPLNGMTLLAGRPGVQKSTIMGTIIAQATNGKLKGECLGRKLNVLIFCSEEDLETAIVPRLLAAGADMRRVYRQTVAIKLPRHMAHLRAEIQRVKADLVVFDPLMSYLIDVTYMDTNKAEQVRPILEMLNDLAIQEKCGIVGIAHLRKNRSDGDFLDFVFGSSAWTQVPRSVLGVIKEGEDDDDIRLFFNALVNQAAPQPVLRFCVEEKEIEAVDGIARVPVAEWLADSDKSEEEVKAMRASKKSPLKEARRQEIAAWVQEVLTQDEQLREDWNDEDERYAVKGTEIYAQGEDMDYSKREILTALNDLCNRRRVGGSRGFVAYSLKKDVQRARTQA
jgi:hypothetical protein